MATLWQSGYLALLVVVVLCIVGVIIFIRAPDIDAPPAANKSIFMRAINVYINPLVSFVRRYTLSLALLLLFFIFFFKIGEAFLGRMSLVFYKEVGFSKTEIGLLSGGLGTITVCIFAILGSFVNARYGLLKGLFLGGIAMAATNLFLAALAIYPSKELFAVAVIADQFTTAVSTVAFVAFISQLCDRTYTATQYAALASIGNLSRTTLAASSGIIVDASGRQLGDLFCVNNADGVTRFGAAVYSQKRHSSFNAGGDNTFTLGGDIPRLPN